jgi:hypothetical protein
MDKPPMCILARERLKGLGDSLLQGLRRACCLRSQARLDLGPTFFNRGEVGRIRWQLEEADTSGGTGGRHACDLRGCESIHDENLAGTELRHPYRTQKGQKALAIRKAFNRHGGDQALETQGA